jgi:predicted O-linked N-acetylglucosamine transferase (SPINDLY family)
MNQFVERSITSEELISIAMNRLRSGDTATAAGICREMLGRAPDNPQLLYLNAVCEHQAGRFDEAEQYFRKAIERDEGEPGYHLGLGRNYKEQGRLEEAAACYRAALGLAPDSLEAIVSLGVSLWRSGRMEEAVELLSRAQERHPDSFEVAANLGNARFNAGGHAEALDAYQRALALRPDSADAHNNIGRALLALEKKDEAKVHFERVLSIKPDHAEALYNVGTLQLAAGDVDAAAQSFARAVEQNANYVDGYIALSKVLYDVGAFDEALNYLAIANRIRPAEPEAHIWRGLVLRERGDFPAALEAFERVAALKPDSPEGHALLGGTYWILGEHEKAARAAADAMKCDAQHPPVLTLQGNLSLLTGQVRQALGWYEKAVAVDPGYVDAFDNLLFVSNYDDEVDAEQLFRRHREWGEKVIDFPQVKQDGGARQNNGRIRIGFVSPDFRNHSVAFFVEPIFANLDRARFELFLYSSDRRVDTTTRRLSDYAAQWTSITALGDDPAAELIAKDRIDVLIDLAGHTAGNRLGVFARRPAPVQATYLGYPTTTGLTTVQYRLTDPVVDPEGAENLNTEQPVRLPASYFCYAPPADAPAVGPLPAATGDGITFGSFNNLAKIGPTAIGHWARTLKAVPGSRLLIKNRGVMNESVQREITAAFEAAGIDGGRVFFMGWEGSTESHLASYGRVDIALDTYPYNGATTTCEALWMGVPVVTLCGPMHASRMGASILGAAGLAQFVAQDEAGFVDIAAGLAGETAALANLRAQLRAQIADSALMAHAKFTRAFEAAMTGLLDSARAR